MFFCSPLEEKQTNFLKGIGENPEKYFASYSKKHLNSAIRF